ncbi:hypothetical protein SprV_0702358200 [Sparganum proliferum]
MKKYLAFIEGTGVIRCATSVGVSRNTAVEWYRVWRGVCIKALLQEVNQLGGPDVEVQVDETMITRRKYNVGRVKKQSWIVGFCRCPIRQICILEDRSGPCFPPKSNSSRGRFEDGRYHPFGLLEFLRMPFGLGNASQTFQRFVERVLRGLPFVYAYIDDLLVASSTAEEHMEHLAAVFDRLQQFGVVLNPSKCVFGMPSLEFLGHLVDSNGIHPLSSKVAAIRDFPPPSSKRQLQQFLGMGPTMDGVERGGKVNETDGRRLLVAIAEFKNEPQCEYLVRASPSSTVSGLVWYRY